ncbi:hypothetical protein CYMTET_24089 [Cymbomonas tetramitiformis]|uniref:Uncharacterized protein n=2 Tax=Cymbomonas tetramitiformis TaxID=36881 RepID=A0AAE0FWG5_9CHLO|nr:hypothetical protein CYMTET_24089 [Cymbomonas tetramitiformis]
MLHSVPRGVNDDWFILMCAVIEEVGSAPAANGQQADEYRPPQCITNDHLTEHRLDNRTGHNIVENRPYERFIDSQVTRFKIYTGAENVAGSKVRIEKIPSFSRETHQDEDGTTWHIPVDHFPENASVSASQPICKQDEWLAISLDSQWEGTGEIEAATSTWEKPHDETVKIVRTAKMPQKPPMVDVGRRGYYERPKLTPVRHSGKEIQRFRDDYDKPRRRKETSDRRDAKGLKRPRSNSEKRERPKGDSDEQWGSKYRW